jgi:CheY-like chemotaxis protein
VIERQLRHVVRLLDDLLEISRISTNKLELLKSPVLLGSIIRAATEASLPFIEAGKHNLTVSLPGEVIQIDCDPVRLTQVFSNLLNNAAKYMLSGGQIAVRATVVGESVEISVKDRGIGIEPDALSRIFEMYWQAAFLADRSQGGLGIGLALARAIVELHGGTIEARSEGTNKGSEFVVKLPLGRRHAAAVVQPPPVARTGSKSRILVVDDLHDSVDALTELLNALGHEAHGSYDGVEAVALAERLRPDVMLVDLGMPELSGHDVCRKVRELPGGRDIYIVALTGWGQASDRALTEMSGFDLHLVKPVDGHTLADLVADVSRRKPAAPAS